MTEQEGLQSQFLSTRNFDIPVGTAAEITTATLIAGMKIILRMGDSNEMHHNHDTLERLCGHINN